MSPISSIALSDRRRLRYGSAAFVLFLVVLGMFEKKGSPLISKTREEQLDEGFGRLTLGTKVDFVARMGDKGLQAGSVRVLWSKRQ